MTCLRSLALVMLLVPAACSAPTPACPECLDAGTPKIRCVSDAECPTDRPICDTELRKYCVGCATNSDCAPKVQHCDFSRTVCRGWPTLTELAPAGSGQVVGLAWDELRLRAVRVMSTGGRPLSVEHLSGNAWTRVSVAESPSERTDAAVAWDGVSQRVLLFGGKDAAGKVLGDTWAWNGERWQSLQSGTLTPRASSAMAWNPARQRVFLYGGSRDTGSALADTWEWSGSAWALVPQSGPPAGSDAVVAFDSTMQSMVLVVYGETWLFGKDATWIKHLGTGTFGTFDLSPQLVLFELEGRGLLLAGADDNFSYHPLGELAPVVEWLDVAAFPKASWQTLVVLNKSPFSNSEVLKQPAVATRIPGGALVVTPNGTTYSMTQPR